MTNSILGIDPGRSKTGLALTDDEGRIIKLHIAMTAVIEKELHVFIEGKELQAVVLGNGTNSETIASAVRNVLPKVQLAIVGEAHSTEEARKLYWQENPPSGLRRMLPLGLQVPPEPLDAYAAVVQIRRWLRQKKI